MRAASTCEELSTTWVTPRMYFATNGCSWLRLKSAVPDVLEAGIAIFWLVWVLLSHSQSEEGYVSSEEKNGKEHDSA
jgi:hypothetical protein